MKSSLGRDLTLKLVSLAALFSAKRNKKEYFTKWRLKVSEEYDLHSSFNTSTVMQHNSIRGVEPIKSARRPLLVEGDKPLDEESIL